MRGDDQSEVHPADDDLVLNDVLAELESQVALARQELRDLPGSTNAEARLEVRQRLIELQSARNALHAESSRATAIGLPTE